MNAFLQSLLAAEPVSKEHTNVLAVDWATYSVQANQQLMEIELDLMWLQMAEQGELLAAATGSATMVIDGVGYTTEAAKAAKEATKTGLLDKIKGFFADLKKSLGEWWRGNLKRIEFAEGVLANFKKAQEEGKKITGDITLHWGSSSIFLYKYVDDGYNLVESFKVVHNYLAALNFADEKVVELSKKGATGVNLKSANTEWAKFAVIGSKENILFQDSIYAGFFMKREWLQSQTAFMFPGTIHSNADLGTVTWHPMELKNAIYWIELYIEQVKSLEGLMTAELNGLKGPGAVDSAGDKVEGIVTLMKASRELIGFTKEVLDITDELCGTGKNVINALNVALKSGK